MQYKKFSDFADEEIPLDGSKVKIDDILNKEILITGYKLRNSKYERENTPKCLTLQFRIGDKKYIIFTGSNVLIDQIEKYRHEIPFVTTVKKINRYYIFT